jgi:hypothetical protein
MVKLFKLPSVLAVFAAISIAACSGQSATQLLPAANAGFPTSDGVSVPDKAAAPNVFIKLNKASVPPGSVSVTITLTKVGKKAVKPAKKTTTNLTKCSAGCTVPGPVSAAGSDTFTIAVFNAKSGKGKILRSGTLVGKVKATKTTLTAKTLAGTVATVAVGSATGASGTASAPVITVTAKDASNNILTGTFANTFTITDADTSGATTLTGGASGTTTSRTFTASTQSLVVNYTGLAIAPVALNPGGTGITGTAGTFTVTNADIVAGIVPAPTTPLEIDLYATSGTGSSATLTLTQAGWSGAFARNFTYATAASGATPNCSSYGITPASGAASVYTISATGSAVAGTCAMTVTGGGGRTKVITLTYSSTSIGINGRHK